MLIMDHLIFINKNVMWARKYTKSTMTITSYIHRFFNKFMQERRYLIFVCEVYFNRTWLRIIRRHITFMSTFPSWPCWLCLWRLCIWIPWVNMLLERRWSLYWQYNMFLSFFGVSFNYKKRGWLWPLKWWIAIVLQRSRKWVSLHHITTVR